jgi:hypothetical protein
LPWQDVSHADIMDRLRREHFALNDLLFAYASPERRYETAEETPV